METMTFEEAKKKCIETFGRFPYMDLRGLPEEKIIEIVQKSIEEGHLPKVPKGYLT